MTTKRRCLIFAGILAACVCLAWAVIAMLPADNRPGITKANFDRINVGMTLAEVVAILGEPAMAAKRTPDDPFYLGWNEFVDGEMRVTIRLTASKDRVVVSKEFSESSETIANQLRRWLRLPK